MVLFLFVIMLVSIDRSMRERQFNMPVDTGIIAATALGGLFMRFFTKGTTFSGTRAPHVENDNTQQIAMKLYGQYMFAFEIARCCYWWRSSERW